MKLLATDLSEIWIHVRKCNLRNGIWKCLYLNVSIVLLSYHIFVKKHRESFRQELALWTGIALKQTVKQTM